MELFIISLSKIFEVSWLPEVYEWLEYVSHKSVSSLFISDSHKSVGCLVMTPRDAWIVGLLISDVGLLLSDLWVAGLWFLQVCELLGYDSCISVSCSINTLPSLWVVGLWLLQVCVLLGYYFRMSMSCWIMTTTSLRVVGLWILQVCGLFGYTPIGLWFVIIPQIPKVPG